LSGKLIIGNSIEIIEESAFYGCSELDQYLTLSNQLKEIGNYAFMNCAFGYTLNLPKTLIKIGA
jgi:hypothetical protein